MIPLVTVAIALFTLLVALVVLGLVYWAITSMMKASGIPFHPVITTGLQIIFAFLGVIILYVLGVPVIQSLVP